MTHKTLLRELLLERYGPARLAERERPDTPETKERRRRALVEAMSADRQQAAA